MYLNNVYDFTVYDIDNDTSEVVRTRPSDIIKSELALKERVDGFSDVARTSYKNYAVLLFALNRLDKLGDYNIESVDDPIASIDQLTEHYAISFAPVEVDGAPLAAQPKK